MKSLALEKLLLHKLQSEFKLATGCTDPAAVACAVAKAKEMANNNSMEQLVKIKVELSPNIFKNGYAVDIPGTTEKGIPMAAALGFIMGESHLGFSVFHHLSQDDVNRAKRLVNEGKVDVNESAEGSELSINVSIETIDQKNIFVQVKKEYLDVVLIKMDDKVIYQKEDTGGHTLIHQGIKIKDLVRCIEAISSGELSFIEEGLKTNQSFVEEGKINPKGLKIGEILWKDFDNTDLGMQIRTMTAIGVDARMGGSSYPVMSSAGSGNLGLGITIPLIMTASHYKLSQEKLIKATALANLVHIYIKELTGKLTSGCGGVLIGMGTSAAIVWLLGGSIRQMEGAMKNVAANLTGMICDGANYGCSLKVSTTAVESYYSAIFALKDRVCSSSDGIVSEDIEQTIRNVANVYLEMTKLDPLILKMLSGNG
jgi:L-cysteine desulfidase